MSKLGILVGIAALALASPALARGPHGGGGGGMYDPKTVETLSGEVTAVDTIAHGGRSGGVHLTVKTDRETIGVHLGPAWYLDKHTPHIAKGDAIDVEGSRVTYDGKPAIIAREVKKGGETLTLRNTAGIPAWAGHGGRP
jgi:hypothetical protein